MRQLIERRLKTLRLCAQILVVRLDCGTSSVTSLLVLWAKLCKWLM